MKLKVSHLSKSFVDAAKRLTVINDVSFELPDSGSVAILGRSGIGKSTLLHLLSGLESADSGSILLGNTDIRTLSQEAVSRFRGANVGVIFQFHHLLNDFSAVENVAMPLLIAGVDSDTAHKKAEKALIRVGLGDRIYHSPGELSGGESQRVAIARALVNRPGLLVADEPTGNLDIHTSAEVTKLLQDVQQESGMLLIAVTHSIEVAQNMDLVFEMLPGGELKSLDKESLHRGWKPSV